MVLYQTGAAITGTMGKGKSRCGHSDRTPLWEKVTPIIALSQEGENMQYRTRYLIYSEAYEGWMNRMADGVTTKMFSALWFHSVEEAEHWMHGIYAPKDIENYVIQETLTTMEVVEDERKHELIRESSISP